MEKTIAVLPGDGIGPEVIRQARKVLGSIEAVFGHKFNYVEGLVGACAIEATGSPFPKETENICRKADAILFGAIGDPKYDNDPSARVRPEQGLLAMREKLGLYANIRPVQSYKALLESSPLKADIIEGTDFVVFRELTGGIYFGKPRGRSECGNVAYDTCVYTKEEIDRMAHLALAAARNRRGKVTLVDKANVLATSRLWRERVSAVAAGYPDVELDYMFVDNAAMQIILNPRKFDVILTENMFGDILTDEASVISGSLGMLPSASVGAERSLFEPIHGSYPEAAGHNIANPFGAILSAAMMLGYTFDMHHESAAIISAVNYAMEAGYVTRDINPLHSFGTEAVGDKVATSIAALSMA